MTDEIKTYEEYKNTWTNVLRRKKKELHALGPLEGFSPLQSSWISKWVGISKIEFQPHIFNT